MEGRENVAPESLEACKHTCTALASSPHMDTHLSKCPQNKKIHMGGEGGGEEKSLFAALFFPAAKLIGSYSCRLYAGSTPTALTLIGVQIAGSGPRRLGKDE